MYSSAGKIWWNWVQIPQIVCRDTWKVIQSLQLLIPHQMRPYFSIEACGGLSYICFTVGYLIGQFEETGRKHPQIIWSSTWKIIQNLQFHISHQTRLYFTIMDKIFEKSYSFHVKYHTTEKFNLYFSEVFFQKYWEDVYFGRKTGQ